jgi:hypothetical protein
MPQSPALLLSMIKLSSPLRGGNAIMNRLRAAAAGAQSGFRSAGNSVRAAVTPRPPTLMDRVRRGANAVSGAAFPLAAVGAVGAGAAGLYGSGYGKELLGQASQMGDSLYGQAAQYADQVRNADYGNEVNELLFRTGVRDRGTLGNMGQSADDFLDRNGIQLPEGVPPISTMGSAAEAELGRLGDRFSRFQF